MATLTTELNFHLYFIFIHLNLKSHMWLIAIVKHSTALGDISLFKVRGRAIMYNVTIIFDSLAVAAINH